MSYIGVDLHTTNLVACFLDEIESATYYLTAHRIISRSK